MERKGWSRHTVCLCVCPSYATMDFLVQVKENIFGVFFSFSKTCFDQDKRGQEMGGKDKVLYLYLSQHYR